MGPFGRRMVQALALTVLLLASTSQAQIAPPTPPDSPRNEFAWVGVTADKTSQWKYGPDGAPDGQFRLSLNTPADVRSITIYTIDGLGEPCCGQVWSTQDTTWWILAVEVNGQPVNTKHVDNLGSLPANTPLDLYGSDSGYFKERQRFMAEIVLGDGSKIRKYTTIGPTPPGPQPPQPGRTCQPFTLGPELDARWKSLGGASGFLGCPTMNETPLSKPTPNGSSGSFAEFDGGDGAYLFRITSGPKARPGVFEVHGCPFKLYKSLGTSDSWLGAPVSDEDDVPGGRRSDFEGGYIQWEAGTGTCRAYPSEAGQQPGQPGQPGQPMQPGQPGQTGGPEGPAQQIDWTTRADSLRGQNGQRFTFICPPVSDPNPYRLWGSGVYTNDSSICKAALHAGQIATAGGTVTIEIRPGQDSYEGSTRNGVSSSSWGSWVGSFVFVQPGGATPEGTLGNTSGPSGGLCNDPRTQQVMDEWLQNGKPPQQPGESLRFEQWGRVVGSSLTANISVAGPPDTPLTRCEWLWQQNPQSTNLGSLRDYVRTRLR